MKSAVTSDDDEQRHAARLGRAAQLGRRRRARGTRRCTPARSRAASRCRRCARGSLLGEVVDLGAAEHEHAPACSCSGQPVSASPGFWIRGTATVRAEPGAARRPPVDAELRPLEQLADRDRQSPSVLGVLVGDDACTSSRRRGAASSRRRNSGSLNTRLIRASAFRCAPVEFSGATSTKNRYVGWPSIESNSTPAGARPRHATISPTAPSLPCGIATPSPIAVDASCSRSISTRDERRAIDARRGARPCTRRAPRGSPRLSVASSAGTTMSRLIRSTIFISRCARRYHGYRDAFTTSRWASRSARSCRPRACRRPRRDRRCRERNTRNGSCSRLSCTIASATDIGCAWNFSVLTTVNSGARRARDRLAAPCRRRPRRRARANASSMIECDHGSAVHVVRPRLACPRACPCTCGPGARSSRSRGRSSSTCPRSSRRPLIDEAVVELIMTSMRWL